MEINITTLTKFGKMLLVVAALVTGGYEAWRKYELLVLNQKISRCEIAELRQYVIEKKPVDNKCWRIALEEAGIDVPP